MNTVLRLDPLTLILTVLIIAASGAGGFFIGKSVTEREIYNDYITTIENNQIQSAVQIQANVDVVNGNEIKNITLSIDNITNIQVIIVSNGVTNQVVNSNTRPGR